MQDVPPRIAFYGVTGPAECLQPTGQGATAQAVEHQAGAATDQEAT